MDEPSRPRPGLFSRFRQGLRAGAAAEKPARIFRYPLHAYGKLPIYKDVISTGLTEPGAREFRNWLDKGFSHRWSVDEGYRQTAIPSHSFLFRLPESKSCVAGTLWGSSDQGGLRRFPFTVFVAFPAGQPAAEPLAALEYLGTFEHLAKGIQGGFGPSGGGSLASFYESHRGAQVDCAVKARAQVAGETRRELTSVTVSQFAESIFGADAPRLWPRFTAALESSASAVRLPLGDLVPQGRQLEFWLLWLEGRDRAREAAVSGFLYENGKGPGRAVLLLRDLKLEDILLLHPGRDDHADVLDPMRELKRAESRPVEPRPVEAMPREPETPSEVAPTPAMPAETASASGGGAPEAAAAEEEAAEAEAAEGGAAEERAVEEKTEEILAPASIPESVGGPAPSPSGVRFSSEAPFPEALTASAPESPEEAPDGNVFPEAAPQAPAAAPVEPSAVAETSTARIDVEDAPHKPPAQAVAPPTSEPVGAGAPPQLDPASSEALPPGWSAALCDLLR